MRDERHLSTADFVAVGGDEAQREREPEHRAEALFPSDVAQDFRSQWDHIQAGFVDEPRAAVAHADELVAGAIKRLAETFSGERTKLEETWDRGGDVSTEELRVALTRYRSFFQRLLSL